MLTRYFGNIIEKFMDNHIAVCGDKMLWTTQILIMSLLGLAILISLILDILLYPAELIIDFIQRR